MISREERRGIRQEMFEQVFLDELGAREIRTGAYNQPDWEESATGLCQCLGSLFQVTPPTAIFVEDRALCLAVMNYLMTHRGLEHRRVALICTDYDPVFDWCEPQIAHLKWDGQAVVRRAVRWAGNIARGKEDQRQHLTPAKLIGGDGIGSIEG